MKIKIIAFLVLINSFSACDSTSDSNLIITEDNKEKNSFFLLEGTVFNDANYVYLHQIKNEVPIITDSAKINNNYFIFEEKKIVPQLVYLTFDDSQKMTLFAENSNVKIDVKGFSKHLIHVTGSEINIEWDKIVATVQVQNVILESLYNDYVNASEIENEELMDKIDLDYTRVDSLKMDIITKYMLQNPKSHITPYLTIKYRLMQSSIIELESYLSDFDSSIQNSIYIPIINTRIADLEKTKIGVTIPDFSQEDIDGNVISISDLRGKYVLIDFWASWCKPCREENPNVLLAYNKYKANGFTVIGVSLDENKNDWLKAIKDDKLDWYQVSDLQGWNNTVANEFGVSSIPFSILIDKEGIILKKNLKGEELQSVLAELF